MYLEVIFEVRLSQEDAIAILVGTTKLLCVLMCVSVSVQLLLCSEGLITTLHRERGGGGGR